MALPGGLNTATITATYTDSAGVAQAGSVSFTPTSAVYDGSGKQVLTETAVTGVLNSSGVLSLGPIPCTDNTGLVPNGWAYSVSVNVPGAQQVFSPVYLPHALGASVDITQLVPAADSPAPSGVSYVPNASPVPVSGPSGGGGIPLRQRGRFVLDRPE